ncbi:MAG: glycosyltransferase family 4 protein [Gaiellaceae bacterium]
MRVLIVSGIWPPDLGGPASHAPELAEFLRVHGHDVEVVTTASSAPAKEAYSVRWVSRGLPAGIRHLATVALICRRAAATDVVYATSMTRRAAFGAAIARRPLVLKLTADEAYERERRGGRFAGDLDAFQHHRGGPRVALLRRTRTWAVRRAWHVFTPSAYLRQLVIGWGIPAQRVNVSPNPAPEVPAMRSREELRAEFGLEGPTLAFAGRLMAAKALDVALAAMALVAEASLVIVGDGPDRVSLERQRDDLGLGDRVRFLGGLEREGVLRVFRAADAVLLSSRWENFPHVIVEALAVGTPVIASAVGGVPEVVRDGENGLLVPAGDADALAVAIRRLLGDAELRARLATAAAPSVEWYSAERLLSQIEAELLKVTR